MIVDLIETAELNADTVCSIVDGYHVTGHRVDAIRVNADQRQRVLEQHQVPPTVPGMFRLYGVRIILRDDIEDVLSATLRAA